MPRFYNPQRTTVPVTLAPGRQVLFAPKTTIELTGSDAASGELQQYVKKGILTRLAEAQPEPAPAVATPSARAGVLLAQVPAKTGRVLTDDVAPLNPASASGSLLLEVPSTEVSPESPTTAKKKAYGKLVALGGAVSGCYSSGGFDHKRRREQCLSYCHREFLSKRYLLTSTSWVPFRRQTQGWRAIPTAASQTKPR